MSDGSPTGGDEMLNEKMAALFFGVPPEYRDKIVFIWTGSDEELQEFLDNYPLSGPTRGRLIRVDDL